MTHPIAPVDGNDRRLLDQVFPSNWVNPTPKKRYDLVVVGAGTGGLVSAAGAAGLGAQVALVERHAMGGDCLNVGCVPSKALIAAARNWERARQATEFGGPTVTGPGDFGAAMTRLRRLRADLSPVDGVPRLAALGVDVFLGDGSFIGVDRLAVGGVSLGFRRAIIATGARPVAPPIPGLDAIDYYTNESIFSLTQLPARVVVIGGGPIGCELAQAFARLGSSVTLLDHAASILSRDDAEAAAVVRQSLVADGVTIHTGVQIEGVRRDGETIVIALDAAGQATSIPADALLVAAGRAPNVEQLGLDAAGVSIDRSGVVVDDRLRTTNPRIFAVGDVCSRYQFTHAADAQARLALANALFFGRGRHTNLIYPRCTYTAPELAQVGLTADEAATRGIRVDTITVRFDEVDRAILDGESTGFLRIHLRRGSDRIVGITIVGANAGELISEGTLALSRRIGLRRLGRAIHPYPTRSEAYRKAADALNRTRLTPNAKRLLTGWFKWMR